jgi:DNA-binding NarL/FixJ family response regulator
MATGKRILIVDDHAAVRKAVIRMLEAVPGIEICGEADNGWVGIEKAQALLPDAVVLDLSMPVMNGLECARILRSVMPSILILMYTSFSNSHLAREALAVGVNKLASKTSPPGALAADLLSLLGLSAQS